MIAWEVNGAEILLFSISRDCRERSWTMLYASDDSCGIMG